jgi:hypothetical protein
MTEQKKKKEEERGGGKRTGRCLIAVLLAVVVVVAECGCRRWRCGGERERLRDVTFLIFFSIFLLFFAFSSHLCFLSFSFLFLYSSSFYFSVISSPSLCFFFCSFFLSFFSLFLSVFIRSLLYNLTPPFFSSSLAPLSSLVFIRGERGRDSSTPV